MTTLVTGATGLVGSTSRGCSSSAATTCGSPCATARGWTSSPASTSSSPTATCSTARAVRRAMRGVERVFHVAGVDVAARAAPTALFARQRPGHPDRARGGAAGRRRARRSTRRRSRRSARRRAARPPTRTRSSAPGATACPTSTPSTRPRWRRMRLAAQGLPVVVVNPAHVFGTGDLYRSSTELVRRFLRRQIPAYVDGALNVVDAEDVARGHLLADERGEVGERYILGNRNFTLDRLFADLARLSGVEPPALKLPLPAALALARAAELAPGPAGGDDGRGARVVAVVGLPLDQGQARARLAPGPPRGHAADDDRLVPRARAQRGSRRRARASRSRCAPPAWACARRAACCGASRRDAPRCTAAAPRPTGCARAGASRASCAGAASTTRRSGWPGASAIDRRSRSSAASATCRCS